MLKIIFFFQNEKSNVNVKFLLRTSRRSKKLSNSIHCYSEQNGQNLKRKLWVGNRVRHLLNGTAKYERRNKTQPAFALKLPPNPPFFQNQKGEGRGGDNQKLPNLPPWVVLFPLLFPGNLHSKPRVAPLGRLSSLQFTGKNRR